MIFSFGLKLRTAFHATPYRYLSVTLEV